MPTTSAQAQGAANRAKKKQQQQTKPQDIEPFPVDTLNTLMSSASRITLVKGFAGRGDLILFYGPPKQGKTFLVSHFAISVGVRGNWFGRKCKSTPEFVLYCALEGGSGMRGRLKGICNMIERSAM